MLPVKGSKAKVGKTVVNSLIQKDIISKETKQICSRCLKLCGREVEENSQQQQIVNNERIGKKEPSCSNKISNDKEDDDTIDNGYDYEDDGDDEYDDDNDTDKQVITRYLKNIALQVSNDVAVLHNDRNICSVDELLSYESQTFLCCPIL